MTVDAAVAEVPVAAPAPAGVDRRFYAFVVDRLVTWPLLALGGWVAWRAHWADGHFWSGLALLAGVAAALVLLAAAVVTWRGATPGKSALGLRVVQVEDARPLGFGQAALRSLVLGLAGLPTFGLGLAGLAQSAVLDPTRQRRGWHDRISGSLVVDVRPPEQVVEEVEEAPRPVVNLTALQLAPAPVGEVADPVLTPPDGETTAVRGAAAAVPAPQPSSSPASPSPAARAAEPPRWRVTLDTGDSLVVEGVVLLGRRPEGRPGETVDRAVPLPSEDLSLSKTHAQLQVGADGSLLVTDRGSTNGSALVRDGAVEQLPAGRPVAVRPGDTVVLGDRRLTVARET